MYLPEAAYEALRETAFKAWLAAAHQSEADRAAEEAGRSEPGAAAVHEDRGPPVASPGT